MRRKNNLVQLLDTTEFLLHEASLKRGNKSFAEYSSSVDKNTKKQLTEARKVFCYILASNGHTVARKRGEKFKKPKEKQVENAFNLMRKLFQGKALYVSENSEDKKLINKARKEQTSVEDTADYFIIEWFDNKKWVDSLTDIS